MASNGAYYLHFKDGEVRRTYCHENGIPGCGVGPWTLVMKIDGHQVSLAIIHKGLFRF